MIVINQFTLLQLILSALYGWLLGIIVNYLADVLPVTRRLSRPTCISCANEYSLKDYLLFKRCNGCREHRTIRTWAVQVIFVFLLVLITIIPLRRIDFWVASVLLVFFAVVVVIDIEYRLILLPVSLVGAVGGAILGWKLNGLESTILGGIAGFAIMLGLYFLGVLFMRAVSRSGSAPTDESALGFGDVYLSGVIGLMLGWMDIIGGLLFAMIIGGIISLLYILITWLTKRYRPLSAIPYGPFLVIGAMIYLFVPAFYYL